MNLQKKILSWIWSNWKLDSNNLGIQLCLCLHTFRKFRFYQFDLFRRSYPLKMCVFLSLSHQCEVIMWEHPSLIQGHWKYILPFLIIQGKKLDKYSAHRFQNNKRDRGLICRALHPFPWASSADYGEYTKFVVCTNTVKIFDVILIVSSRKR